MVYSFLKFSLKTFQHGRLHFCNKIFLKILRYLDSSENSACYVSKIQFIICHKFFCLFSMKKRLGGKLNRHSDAYVHAHAHFYSTRMLIHTRILVYVSTSLVFGESNYYKDVHILEYYNMLYWNSRHMINSIFTNLLTLNY